MTLRAKQMVEKVGGTLLGVVLNNINISHDSYYYYYSGYYYDYYNKQDEEPSSKNNGEKKKPSEERANKRGLRATLPCHRRALLFRWPAGMEFRSKRRL